MTIDQQRYAGHLELDAMDFAINYSTSIVNDLDKLRIFTDAGKVLDFGAGKGGFAQILMQKGLEVCALEPDRELRMACERRGLNTASCIDEVSDSKFDLIYSINVLEHIENDLEVLRELKFLLKGNKARIFIFVPAFQFLFTNMDRDVGHLRRYDRQMFVSLAREAGLDIERLEYFDQVGFFATLILKLCKFPVVVSPATVKFFDKYLFLFNKLFFARWMRSLVGKNLIVVMRQCE